MASKTEQWLRDHMDYPHDYCLIWPFARESRVGRGVMGSPRKWAHRAMCEMVHGPAPTPKHQAAHDCGNGDQGCVNPRHLKWKTNSQNQIDRYRVHGRFNPNPTGNKGRYTPEQIEKMRSQYGEFTQVKLAEMYGCSLGTIQYYLKYRDLRGHAGRKIDHWHPDEEEKLREGISSGMNLKQVADLVGRSEGAVTGKVYKLGLTSGQPVRKIAP